MSTPHKEREPRTTATPVPPRDTAPTGAGAVPERPADDHLIRGYN